MTDDQRRNLADRGYELIPPDEARGPRTEAGRALGVDVEQELGLQFKSNEAYRGWLATADRLARAIEDEARAAVLREVRVEVEGLHDGVGYIVRDEQGGAFDPAVIMRNAILAIINGTETEPVCAHLGCGLPKRLHGAPPGEPPNPTRSTHRFLAALTETGSDGPQEEPPPVDADTDPPLEGWANQ